MSPSARTRRAARKPEAGRKRRSRNADSVIGKARCGTGIVQRTNHKNETRPKRLTNRQLPKGDEANGCNGQKPKKAESKEGEAHGRGASWSLSTTSTRQLGQLKVKAEQQQLAHVGEIAPVTLPGGRIVHGRIIEVGTVAQLLGQAKKKAPAIAGGEGESATIAVTLALDHPVARLDQAPVSVELVKSVRRHVLTVPADALTATAGGGYAIAVAPRRAASSLSAVTPGMFADGYVQIEGAGRPSTGMTVLEPQ